MEEDTETDAPLANVALGKDNVKLFTSPAPSDGTDKMEVPDGVVTSTGTFVSVAVP